jgi:UPF0716 protein FxsA
MLRFFILLLTVAEVMALVASFTLLGFWATLALSFLAMMIGGAILRREGLKTAERFVTKLEFGHAPMEESWDGLCLMVAAILFIIPGLVTDFVALILLVPPVRRALYRVFARPGDYRYDEAALAPSRVTIIEGHWQDITPQ